jgi:hypothetical protein
MKAPLCSSVLGHAGCSCAALWHMVCAICGSGCLFSQVNINESMGNPDIDGVLLLLACG